MTNRPRSHLYIIIIIELVRIVQSSNDIGYALHISDIHSDLEYSPGSPTHCVGGKLGLRCCRKYDIPLYGSHPASPWGSYNCDTPMSLVESTFEWIKENLYLDVIIWTGDSVDHHDIGQTWEKNRKEIG